MGRASLPSIALDTSGQGARRVLELVGFSTKRGSPMYAPIIRAITRQGLHVFPPSQASRDSDVARNVAEKGSRKGIIAPLSRAGIVRVRILVSSWRTLYVSFRPAPQFLYS